MRLRDRISLGEKYEVLSTLSPNVVLIIAGFLAGGILSLLLCPLIIKGMEALGESVDIKMLVLVLGLGAGSLGSMAAKFLQWEYKINQKAYKRTGEFHIPIVYPFYFLICLAATIVLAFFGQGVLRAYWEQAIAGASGINIGIISFLIILGLAILSSALVVIWRFWHIFCLSLFSPINWKAVIEVRHFENHLKMSFAEVKRYPSPLSLTLVDIDQLDQFPGRTLRKAQEGLLSVVDKNVREVDVIGRIDGSIIVITMTHAGSSGANIQAKRLKKTLEEYLSSLHKEKKITLSVGIAIYSPEFKTYKDLIDKSHAALDKAKAEGGDRVITFQ